MGAGLFFFYLVSGLISGGICAWVAKEKGRSGINWFLLGFLFNLFAIVALAAVPSTKNKGETTPLLYISGSSTRDNYNKPTARTTEIAPSYFGVPSLENDSYKIYLTEKYKVTKNDLFGKYVCDGIECVVV